MNSLVSQPHNPIPFGFRKPRSLKPPSTKRGFLEPERYRRQFFCALALVLLAGSGLLNGCSVFAPATPVPAQFTSSAPVRLVRIDYSDLANSRDEVAGLEKQMQQVGVNMIGLGAGRVDWTYFPWSGHSNSWSDAVRTSGIDYLKEDTNRFGKWSQVYAVIDVLSPLYIKTHPEAAAISYSGQPSQNLVGLMEVVEGPFGTELLSMIDYIAVNYPVNAIALSELTYYVDGFGPKDKAAFLAYSKLADWPQTTDGKIDLDNPAIGRWRAYEVGRFLEKAAAVVHKSNKQLFVEVHINLDAAGKAWLQNGTDYDMMLKYADKLLVWGNYSLEGRALGAIVNVAYYLTRYDPKQMIVMIGLWDKNYPTDTPKQDMSAIPAEDLRTALAAADQGAIKNLGVVPSFLLGDEHWRVLQEMWNPAAP
jgi:hypothetical protein